jgi:MFS family permease
LVGDLAGPELRRQGFALNRLAVNLGMSVGPALGGILATFSFNSIFWVDGATSLAAAAVLALQPLHSSRGEKERMHPRRGSDGLIPIFTDRKLMYFLLALLPAMLVFFQHNSTMAVFVVSELGFSEAIYGLLFTFNTLIIVLLEVRINAATAHWSHRRALALAGALIGLGFGSLALAKSLWLLLGTVAIWTFGEMILLPVASSYVTEIAPPARRGEYMGYYTMCFGLAFTLGPGAGTAIMQHYGSTTLWLSALVVGLICAVLLGRVPAPESFTQLAPGTQANLSAK